MNRFLRLLAIILHLVLIAIGWLWWNQPRRIDMAANVPADSLVYLEANSLPDIAAAITGSEGWQRLGPYLALKPASRQSSWLTYWIKTTGIGSTVSVIAARAQLAVVLLDLSSISNGDTLEYKQLAALVVETHTAASRIKPAVEGLLGEIAGRTYGRPNFERVTVGGEKFVRWIAPDGQRRIVASFDESVVVVGNDERAVSACLAARRGQRPSLLHQPELEETRFRLHAGDSLAFGYVAAANIPRLVSESAPLYLGKLPPELQKLLAVGAAKILGTVGWSVRSVNGGIEDSYFLSLQPGVVAHLRPTFQGGDQGLAGAWQLVPADAASVTSYNLRDPAAAWDSANAAISSQVDVLSAVFLTTGSRALFEPYGIDEPGSFLKAIKPEVLTIRLGAPSERALVIAKVADARVLQQFVSRRFGAKPRAERVGAFEFVTSADEQFAASFTGEYFVLGSPADVRRCLSAQANHNTITSSPVTLASLTHYLERPGNANFVTYAKDNERVRALVSTLVTIRGSAGSAPSASKDDLDHIINELPYATTETTLSSDGFERRTRSPFGQFGSLLSLLVPEPARRGAP